MSNKLQEIAESSEFGSITDQLEMTSALGNVVEIAGYKFNAPSAAVIALLDAIDSPFVAEQSAPVDTLAVLRTLYVLAKRQEAALPIMRLKRREKALEALKSTEDTSVVILAEQLKLLADAEAELDEKAIIFGEELGAFELSGVSADICLYIAMATGFSMLPDGDVSKKKSDIA